GGTVAAVAGTIVAGAGPGGGSLVKVFGLVVGDPAVPGTGRGLLLLAVPGAQLAAFDAGFAGGVNVALHDLPGDGGPDTVRLVVGAGPGGGPNVKVYDGLDGTPVSSTFAFDPASPGAAFVGRR